MKKKKFPALATTALIVSLLVTGCSEKSSETAENTETQESFVSSEEETDTLIVQVTNIEGDTITADAGTLEAAGAPQNAVPDGETPGGNAPDANAPGGNAPDGNAPGGNAPDGNAPDGNTPDANAPDANAPDGNAPDANAPDANAPNGNAPDGNAPSSFRPENGMGSKSFQSFGESITFQITDATVITVEFLQGSQEGAADDITIGSVLEIIIDEQNQAEEIIVKNLNAGGGFGGSSEVTNGTSANTVEEDTDIDSMRYTSDGDDENALRVDGVKVSIQNTTIEKTGGSSSNTENGDFYGQNAAFLALNGADVTISNAEINTSAINGNGVFSYGEGTTVTISDSVIRTMGNNSGGIQTTGGGTTHASNLDIETQGNSSAAIRSDRGGGTVNADGGTYVTNGTGSPAVYCTADIQVSNATLTANASEAVVVEGKNSVSLTDCVLTGNMDNTYNGDPDENIHAIMIYQSMSGDAAIGEASFSAKGGSITSKSGDMFYITNTDCTISLKEVVFTLANDTFLRVEGNSSSRGWGTEGANGGDVILYADTQKIEGNILVDDISSLNFQLGNGTSFTGAVNPNGEAGTVDVVLDETSFWILTGDSYITSFDGDISNVTANGFHLYVNGELLL